MILDAENNVVNCYPINPADPINPALSEAMQVQLINMTTFDGNRVKYFDLHEEFGFTSIVEREETVELHLNGVVVQSWPKGARPEIWWLKWFDAIMSSSLCMGRKLRSSRPNAGNEYFSQKYMFATYGDEAFYSSRPIEVESNIISVFLRNGTFELGIRELMDKDRDAWKFEESHRRIYIQ